MVKAQWLVMVISAFDGELTDPVPCATLDEAKIMRDAMRARKHKGKRSFKLVWIEQNEGKYAQP